MHPTQRRAPRALRGSARGSEVLRDGLRLVQRREARETPKLEALRNALDEAEAAVADGDLTDYTASLLDEIDAEERAGFARSSGV